MIAQLYQPERPIEVGNRHPMFRATVHHIVMPRDASCRNSTFPSLVGSFESRLGVGNCQPRIAPLHGARRRCAPRRPALQVISTNTKLSSNRIRAVIGGLVLPRRSSARRNSSRHTAQFRISTNYATQRRRPSGRVRWVSHQPGASRRPAAHGIATLRFATHLNDYPAKRRPPSGGVRFAGTTAHRPVTRRSASLCSAPFRATTHLNGRPSGRHPQRLDRQAFGMPSLASTTTRVTALRIAGRRIARHLNAPTYQI